MSQLCEYKAAGKYDCSGRFCTPDKQSQKMISCLKKVWTLVHYMHYMQSCSFVRHQIHNLKQQYLYTQATGWNNQSKKAIQQQKNDKQEI